MGFIKEFLIFLKVRKKFWLAPLLLFIILLGGILLFAQSGSVLSPLMYTIF